MSTDRDLERIVRSWMDEGVTQLPDRVLDLVLDQVPATPQRSASWLARRFPIMNSNAFRVGIAAAVVVIAAIIGFNYLNSNVGTDEPTPTPIASPADSPSPGQLPASGELIQAGRYATLFEPSLSFTAPVGWLVGSNTPTEFSIGPAALESTGAGIIVCRNTRAVDARNQILTGVDSDAESIMSWLAERRDLREVTASTPATIGGLDGFYVDFHGPEPAADPNVVVEVAIVGPGSCGINAYSQQVTRLGVFDVPSGGNVLIIISSPAGDEGVIQVGTPIVESFVFDVP